MSEITKSKKVAVVLFNLGGPDSLKSVEPFLFNLFNDKYIITLPKYLRYFVAWLISSRRRKTAEKIYQNIGGKSPILEETLNQADSLRKTLNDSSKDLEFKIFINMRHWHPMAAETIDKIVQYNPDELILLPLYPQFSTTTTASSIENFQYHLNKSSLKDKVKPKIICCYPQDKGFIEAHSELILDKIKEIKDHNNYRILFSAHGLPEKIIKSGDPYQWQVEQTVDKIVDNLQINNLDYKVTYQSRVGPLKWIGPNTEDEIKLAGSLEKNLIIVPVAFVSEHVETLVELDIEYKEIAESYNIKYLRVPTLSTSSKFIDYLAQIIKERMNKDHKYNQICPNIFTKCFCVPSK